MQKSVHVPSETGKLKKVLIHRPDEGIEKVTPSRALDLLYEDIVYLPKMLEEHDVFTQALSLFTGRENLIDVETLLCEVLKEDSNRKEILSQIKRLEDLSAETIVGFKDLDSKSLTKLLITGSIGNEALFSPLPNFIFTRDIGAIVNGHLISGMAFKEARNRESLLASFIFHHHPLFYNLSKEGKIIDLTNKGINILHRLDERNIGISIEGGDIMIINKEHLMIASSERSSIKAVTRVIKELLEKNVVNRVSHVDLPKERYCMHLDTIFTVISKNEGVCFEPLIIKEDKMPVMVYTKMGDVERFSSVKSLLKNENPDMEFIPCGEGITPFEEREQWTDGCNMVAVKEGVCFGYDRNIKTNKALKEHGYTILKASDFIGEVSSGKIIPEKIERTIITIPSSELSRARGGPHCMTMPLIRE